MKNLTLGGRYRVLDKIGDGGFGQTFLAEDLQLPGNPKCVVKKLKTQHKTDESIAVALRLFEQEVEVLYRLGERPQIPKLLAHIVEKGEFYLVQEFIDGCSLDDEIEAGKLFSEPEAIGILRQLLEVLSFVHERGVIHRDVKPANIMRRKADGRIILIDFGAVKQVSVIPGNSLKHSTITIGSEGFMPGEQLIGKPRFASDVYAAGLVIIQLLTNVHPALLRQSRRTGELIWQDKIAVSPALAYILDRMIRYDYRHRYQTAGEVLKALDALPEGFPAFAAAQTIQLPAAAVASPVWAEKAAASIPATYFQPAVLQLPKKGVVKPPTSVGNIILGVIFSGAALAGVCLIALIVILVGWSAGTQTGGGFSGKNPKTPGISEAAGYSVYKEALEQGREADLKARKAATRQEWEAVVRQYERAVKLLESVDFKSDDYVAAQQSLGNYRKLLANAREQAAKFKNIAQETNLPPPAISEKRRR